MKLFDLFEGNEQAYNWHSEPEQRSMDATRSARLYREREPEGSEAIDARLRAQNDQLAQYAKSGNFWLKQKDTQEHISDVFVGKAAAQAAARELLQQRPELQGNLVITAWGPGEQQGVAEDLSRRGFLRGLGAAALAGAGGSAAAGGYTPGKPNDWKYNMGVKRPGSDEPPAADSAAAPMQSPAPASGSLNAQSSASRAAAERAQAAAAKIKYTNPKFKEEYDRIENTYNQIKSIVYNNKRQYSADPDLARRQHAESVKTLIAADKEFAEKTNALINQYGRLKEQGVAEGSGFGMNYAEQLAQQVFDYKPDLDNEDAILNLGYNIAKSELGSRAQGIFRDEDFPSDFVSAYSYLRKQGVAEGIKGEVVGGTAGGIVGQAAGSALGPIGSMVGGAAGGALGSSIGGRWEDGAPLKEREQIEEIAPLIAAGARALIPLLAKVGPKLGQMVARGGQAAAPVVKKGAEVAAKGAGQAIKQGAEIAAKNAAPIGVGAGAYTAITDIAQKLVGGVGKVYNDTAGAASDIASKIGNAVDEKTILELATLAVKYALPVGIVIALLYGGKKVIDQIMSEDLISSTLSILPGSDLISKPADRVSEEEKIGNMPADKFDDAITRLKQLAGAGPLKTVWDPQKRVYKNVPTAVQPKK